MAAHTGGSLLRLLDECDRGREQESEYARIGADLDAVARGLANLRGIDELSPGDFVKVAGEECEIVSVHLTGQVLRVRREGSACEWEYHVTEGERFVWSPGVGF